MKVALSKLVRCPKLAALRPVNLFVVSEYRQRRRQGVDLGRWLVEKGSLRIVSGNHRYEAELAEFGPDHVVDVETREYASEKDLLTDFAEHNLRHGRPLDSWQRKKIMNALTEEGAKPEELSQLFGISVQRIEQWGEQTICIRGKGSAPIKHGFEPIAGNTVTVKAYTEHSLKDRGEAPWSLANRLSMILERGPEWIDLDDPKTVAALDRLAKAIESVTAKV